jgi:hypothetical protein
MEQILVINPDGSLEFIYNDELRDLVDQGDATITRVSNVEPNENGEWIASMCDGAHLGPYRFRQDALDAEVEHIYEHLLGKI